MKEKKTKRSISKQDTAELDKSWFNDLEPPKRYGKEETSKGKTNTKKKTGKSSSNKSKSKSKKNSKAKPNANREYYIEPPRKDVRQRSVNGYDNRSRRNIEDLSVNERRAEQNLKRKKKNKIRKIFTGILVILITIAVAVVLSLTVFFPINSIEVSGNKNYTKEQITDICGIRTKENLFLAKTDEAENSLKTNLPFIRKAEVKRKLPGIITIKVTETSPKFSIKQNKSYIYLDDELKVLEISTSANKNAVPITGTVIKSSVTGHTVEFKNKNTKACLDEILKSINSTKLQKVTSIGSKSMTDNYLVYDGRITIKFGDTDNMDYKIYQALAAIDKLDTDNPSVKGIINATGDKAIYFTEK